MAIPPIVKNWLNCLIRSVFVFLIGIDEFYCQYSYLRVNRLADILFHQYFVVKRKFIVGVSGIDSKSS